MKSYIKEYRENLPIILLGFYIMGFSYYFSFYHFFDIEIEHYINLNDIIFKSIKLLLKTIFFFVVVEFILFILTYFGSILFEKKFDSKKFKSKEINIQKRYERYVGSIYLNNDKYYSFTAYLILVFFVIVTLNEKIFYLSIILPNLLYKFYSIIPKEEKDNEVSLKLFIYTSLFFVLLFCYGYWGYYDASKIKENYSSKVIKIEGLFTGDGINKFVGETSLYYFVLNSKNDVVTVIKKDNLKSVMVEKNKYEIEERKLINNKLSFFEEIKEYIYEK
jgi:hypothetical protein